MEHSSWFTVTLDSSNARKRSVQKLTVYDVISSSSYEINVRLDMDQKTMTCATSKQEP